MKPPRITKLSSAGSTTTKTGKSIKEIAGFNQNGAILDEEVPVSSRNHVNTSTNNKTNTSGRAGSSIR